MPLPALIPLIGLGISAASAAYGAYNAEDAKKKKRKADAEARQALANAPEYTESEASKEMLADSRARNGAVSPAVIAAYQIAQQQQANQQAFAQRNASSGAQALAIGADAQAQTQGLLPQLSGQQEAYAQQNRARYYDALSGMDTQYQRKFQSQQDRASNMFNFNLGQVGAANADKSAGWAMAANGVASLANSDWQGAFRGSRPIAGGPMATGGYGYGASSGLYPYSNNYRLQSQWYGY